MYTIELHQGNSIRKLSQYKSPSKAILNYNTILSKNVLIEQKFFRKKNFLVPVSWCLVLKKGDEIMFRKPHKIEEKFAVGNKRLNANGIVEKLFAPIRGYHCAVSYYGHWVIVNNFRKLIPIGCKTHTDAIRLYKWLMGELHEEFMFMGLLANQELLGELKKMIPKPSRKNTRSFIKSDLE